MYRAVSSPMHLTENIYKSYITEIHLTVSAFFGFWTLGSTARLVMHECAVVRNNAVAQGRSSAHTANTDKNCTRILLHWRRCRGQRCPKNTVSGRLALRSGVDKHSSRIYIYIYIYIQYNVVYYIIL